MNDQTNTPEGSTVAEFSSFRGRGSLADVVKELERQAEKACDFVADTRDMEWVVGEKGDLRLKPKNDNLRDYLPQEGIPLLDQALSQVAGKAPIAAWTTDDKKKNRNAGIPIRFFRAALKQHPGRTLDFLNGTMWDEGKRRLVRCLDDKVRAFLSDQYRDIPTLSVAKHALKVIQGLDGKVIEASVTDSHIRIKVVATDIWDRIEATRTGGDSSEWYAGGLGSQEMLSRVAAKSHDDLRPLKEKMEDQGGDQTVWPSATILNSPTGHGGLEFRGGFLKGICFNLATVEQIMRAVHLGSRLDTGIYQRDTVEAEAEAIFLKLRDNLTSWFTQEKFTEVCDKMRASTEKKIEKPSAAVKLLVEGDLIQDSELDDVLAHFIKDEHQTVHGLGQAVSRFAQDVDADRAEELEELAGALCLGKENKVLAEAITV